MNVAYMQNTSGTCVSGLCIMLACYFHVLCSADMCAVVGKQSMRNDRYHTGAVLTCKCMWYGRPCMHCLCVCVCACANLLH